MRAMHDDTLMIYDLFAHYAFSFKYFLLWMGKSRGTFQRRDIQALFLAGRWATRQGAVSFLR